MLRVVDWDQLAKVADAEPTVGVYADVPCVCRVAVYYHRLYR